MRFDPHRLHPDDGDAGDPAHGALPVGDLPPHLADLARRLETEAARLGDKYPPGKAGAPPEVARPAVAPLTWGLRWRIAAAAAAMILAAVGTALLDWTPAPAQPRPAVTAHFGGEQRPPAAPLGGIRPVAHGGAEQDVREPQHASPLQASPLPAPAGLPAMLFHELSAPQQEAVLDLLEEQGLEHADLSI